MIHWSLSLATKSAIATDSDTKESLRLSFDSFALTCDEDGYVSVSIKNLLLNPTDGSLQRTGVLTRRASNVEWRGDVVEFDIAGAIESIRLSPVIPTHCKTCRFFHGEHGIVCGIHPFGLRECGDRESKEIKAPEPAPVSFLSYEWQLGDRDSDADNQAVVNIRSGASYFFNSDRMTYTVRGEDGQVIELTAYEVMSRSRRSPVTKNVLLLAAGASNSVDDAATMIRFSASRGDRLELRNVPTILTGPIAATFLKSGDQDVALISFPSDLLQHLFRFYHQESNRWYEGELTRVVLDLNDLVSISASSGVPEFS